MNTDTIINKPEIFSIDAEVLNRFPSIHIGIAIIRGVTIKKSDLELVGRIRKFIHEQQGLTNEVVGSYPEIQSYRRLYKEMKVDWHSRRPSPEALLRRIAQGKGLYTINTCVDAYNLVVLQHRISSGAFDLDTISFPTVLRFAQEGEQIELLGDAEPTLYKSSELAYFDRVGGYNIDFNYRDAKRTAVTEHTKNLFINIDGVYDISRAQVQAALDETVSEIVRYCGGTVELKEIVGAK